MDLEEVHKSPDPEGNSPVAVDCANVAEIPGIQAKSIGPRFWLFIPKAKLMAFSERKRVYKIQKRIITDDG